MGRNVQLSDPADVSARNERMRADSDVYVPRYDWIFGHDAESDF